FGVARRIVLAALVDRIDQAGAEQIGPDAIDGGASEMRVLRRRQPLRQGRARTDARLERRLAAAEEASRHRAVDVGDGDLRLALVRARRRAGQVGEESSELPELVARAVNAGTVVVAL